MERFLGFDLEDFRDRKFVEGKGCSRCGGILGVRRSGFDFSFAGFVILFFRYLYFLF